MKKLNRKQKEKVKDIFFKGLHVISYILSVLFILSMVIFGIQSCHKPKSVSAESINYNYSYRLRDKGTVNYDFEDFIEYNKLYDVPFTNVSPRYEVGDTLVFDSDLARGTTLYNASANTSYERVQELTTLRFIYKVYSANLTTRYFRLSNIQVFNNLYTWDLVEKYDSGVNDYRLYYNEDKLFIVSDGAFYNIKGVSTFLFDGETKGFSFANPFNFNAPLGTTINGVYGTSSLLPSTEALNNTITYDLPFFLSGGKLYDTIIYEVYKTGYQKALFTNNDGSTHIAQTPNNNNWLYYEMYYENSETGAFTLVNYRDYLPYDNNGTIENYYSNSTTWVDSKYSYLLFLGALSEDEIDTLNAFNNNMPSYTGNVTSGSQIDNIFVLIGSAIGGLSPILTTVILPGITIGTLLFIPLVAMLVFAIIRIIKK